MKTLLTEISEIKSSYQSREGIQIESNGSHCLIQAKDFDKQHRIQWSELKRFTPTGTAEKYELKDEDILFLARGPENFACCIDQDPGLALATNSFYILRANPKKILPSYLAWWLNQTPAHMYYTTCRSGSSIPFISTYHLSQLMVPVPTFEIQNKILKLESLQKMEINLIESYLEKRSTLIETLCINAINKE